MTLLVRTLAKQQIRRQVPQQPSRGPNCQRGRLWHAWHQRLGKSENSAKTKQVHPRLEGAPEVTRPITHLSVVSACNSDFQLGEQPPPFAGHMGQWGSSNPRVPGAVRARSPASQPIWVQWQGLKWTLEPARAIKLHSKTSVRRSWKLFSPWKKCSV